MVVAGNARETSISDVDADVAPGYTVTIAGHDPATATPAAVSTRASYSPDAVGVYLTVYVPSPSSTTTFVPGVVAPAETRVMVSAVPEPNVGVSVTTSAAPPAATPTPSASAASTTKDDSSPATATRNPSPNARVFAGDTAPATATARTAYGDPATCSPPMSIVSSYASDAVAGTYSTTYVPSPVSVTVVGGAAATPAVSTTRACTASPPVRRAFPFASRAVIRTVPPTPTIAPRRPAPWTSHAAPLVAPGAARAANGEPATAPIPPDPPDMDRRTLTSPAIAGVYVPSYRPATASHASATADASNAVTLPDSHVGSSPSTTTDAVAARTRPGSGAVSTFPYRSETYTTNDASSPTTAR